jgi:hypothetical protein
MLYENNGLVKTGNGEGAGKETAVLAQCVKHLTDFPQKPRTADLEVYSNTSNQLLPLAGQIDIIIIKKYAYHTEKPAR